MFEKLCAVLAWGIAIASISAGYTQISALHLRQESQPLYAPRHNTLRSGYYRSGRWTRRPGRSSYDTFRGGGSRTGK